MGRVLRLNERATVRRRDAGTGMSVLDDSGNEFRVDLTNCDREPIHVPGHVQPFGTVFALNPDDFTILQVSENVAERFGIAPADLLGCGVGDLLSEEQVAALDATRRNERIERNPVEVFVGSIQDRGPFRALAHTFRGLLLLEVEDAGTPEDVVIDYPRLVSKTLVRLQDLSDLREFFDNLAQEFREINGFDRVMIYHFLEDASGTVVGEALAEGMESFMGLHYPASDIPAQARQLFLLNGTRLISNPGYEPSVVTPVLNPLTGKPLDMSFAASRGVSPIHCQYLRNMGVGASMSQALVVDGQLWGLVASHNRTPREVPYQVRTALEFLARSASLLIKGKVLDVDTAYIESAARMHDQLVECMATQPTIIEGLTGTKPRIDEFVSAGGCAVIADGECHLLGATPGAEAVKRLVAWLKIEHPGELFATNSLAGKYVEAEAIKETASGLLAIRITRVPGEYVLWFRPEKPQTVNWAGNPTKPVEPGPYGDRLYPRKSFEIWKEEVRLTSEPWRSSEIEAVRRLRIAITEAVLRRAEEVSRANVRLERSNVELDSFAYIASHDLKEPLRGIHNYATFLLEDYGHVLDDPGRERLGTLVRLAERMETLTDSLLHYSRLGRQDLNLRDNDLNKVVSDALEATGLRLEETGTEVRIPWPLPTVRCDAVQLVEVFQNLVANAAKYNDKGDRWVEIGVLRGAETKANEQPYVLYVQDNGIGIAARHHDTIFRIFKRLHGRNDFGGGSGAGLTIAKKIVERHGGRMWLESEPGTGTTFFFTLGSAAKLGAV